MFYRAFVYKQTNFVKKHTNVKERFYWVAEINLIVFACVILFVMARLIYRLPNYGYSLAHTTLSRKINVIHSLSSYKFSQKLKTNHYLEAQVYESFDLFDIMHFGLKYRIYKKVFHHSFFFIILLEKWIMLEYAMLKMTYHLHVII